MFFIVLKVVVSGSMKCVVLCVCLGSVVNSVVWVVSS